MLQINQLSYAYLDKKRNTHEYCYDLDIEAGHCVAIIGKSGSGKSTLLELMAGFLMPSSGDISLDDHSLISLPAEKRPISILFQEANLFNHLSVFQNIALGLSPSLSLSAEMKLEIDKALEKTELANFKNRLPESLSGGQRQRVGLLRCLLRKKPILLLDEPFSALNHELREEYKQWIIDYKNQHKAYIIWVTHDIEDVKGVADDYYLMSDYQLTKQDNKAIV